MGPRIAVPVLLLAACALPSQQPPLHDLAVGASTEDGATSGHDLAAGGGRDQGADLASLGPDLEPGPRDLAGLPAEDLSHVPVADLASADLASAALPDLAAADLAMTSAADLAPWTHRDLALVPSVDLEPPADLRLPPDLTVLPDLTVPPDLRVLPDLTRLPDLAGLGDGAACVNASDCQSGACQPVGPGGTSICVRRCVGAADCVDDPATYCAPVAPGSPTGYCVPRSPDHCASCQRDRDCAGLSEACTTGPGDTALACHVDCALGGASACPVDYACSAVVVGGANRMLCLPNLGACLDALGGDCGGGALPQPCARDNAAGRCLGQRACLIAAGRYDQCSAAAPQFKATCADQDPAGCTERYSPTATQGLSDCGACGNVCPGQNLSTDDVSCDPATASCTFTCRGENYDVNADPADGCEFADEDPPGHDLASATARPDHDCNDGTVDTFAAHLPSDARAHANPPVVQFDGALGASFDWWKVRATGGLCYNSYNVTFTTTGGGNTACYQLRFITDQKTVVSPKVNGHGTVKISNGGTGNYSDGSTIYFVIEKTCSLPVQEAVSYSVRFNL